MPSSLGHSCSSFLHPQNYLPQCSVHCGPSRNIIKQMLKKKKFPNPTGCKSSKGAAASQAVVGAEPGLPKLCLRGVLAPAPTSPHVHVGSEFSSFQPVPTLKSGRPGLGKRAAWLLKDPQVPQNEARDAEKTARPCREVASSALWVCVAVPSTTQPC